MLKLLLAVITINANAGFRSTTEGAPGAQQKPLVIFIGGANASQADVDCWAASAKNDPQYSKIYDFKAYGYPKAVTLNHGSDKEQGGIDLVNRIDRETVGDRPIVIVGHSSGSDLANALAVKMNASKKRISKIINLDGYGVPAGVSKIAPVECFSVHGDDGRGNDLHSLYWENNETKCSGGKFYPLKAEDCGHNWVCMHFRMINPSASRSINLQNYGDIGYRPTPNSSCSANLEWLGPQKQNRTQGGTTTTSS